MRIPLTDFYDKTLYELSIELDAYTVQWEDRWSPFRALYTLMYNMNLEKGKPKKKAWELIPFPSEAEEIAWQNKWRNKREGKQLQQQVTGRGDGRSRIDS